MLAEFPKGKRGNHF